MNILMLRPQVELGGVTSHIGLLASKLAVQRHSVSLVTTYNIENKQRLDWLEQKGVNVLYTPLHPSTPLNLFKSISYVSELVHRNRIDILHSHHRFTTILGRLVSLLTNTPLVVTVHEFKQNWRILAPLWTGKITITPSQALKNHIQLYYKVPDSRVFVIPHGVPLAHEIGPDRHAALRYSLNLPAGGVCIAFIGRLSPEKGCRYFLESIPLIDRAKNDVRFIVVGSGPEEVTLRAAAKNYEHDIVFLGSRDDVTDLLQLVDIVVIPSVEESFSLVAVEAMLAARPVVAAAVGGLLEVVRHGTTGFLVTPKSPSDLASHVSKLIADPVRRHILGSEGRQVAQREYTVDVLADRTIQIYKLASSIGKKKS